MIIRQIKATVGTWFHINMSVHILHSYTSLTSSASGLFLLLGNLLNMNQDHPNMYFDLAICHITESKPNE